MAPKCAIGATGTACAPLALLPARLTGLHNEGHRGPFDGRRGTRRPGRDAGPAHRRPVERRLEVPGPSTPSRCAQQRDRFPSPHICRGGRGGRLGRPQTQASSTFPASILRHTTCCVSPRHAEGTHWVLRRGRWRRPNHLRAPPPRAVADEHRPKHRQRAGLQGPDQDLPDRLLRPAVLRAQSVHGSQEPRRLLRRLLRQGQLRDLPVLPRRRGQVRRSVVLDRPTRRSWRAGRVHQAGGLGVPRPPRLRPV